MINLPVRFFAYDNEAEELDIKEVTESDFLEQVANGYSIDYVRHTMRENGVSQICLTVNNIK